MPKLDSSKFVLGDRVLTTDTLKSACVLHRPADLKGDDASAFTTWSKTLFDTGSEGIEDSILRSTKPRSLLRIAASLLSHSIYLAIGGKLEKEALNNGVSYFQSPLLNWTLGGVVKAILQDYQQKGFVLVLSLCPSRDEYSPSIGSSCPSMPTYFTICYNPHHVLHLYSVCVRRSSCARSRWPSNKRARDRRV